ncbi:MAG: peptide chain release factor N(5)-glutamine methyltransferase [Clostridiales bacterium]|nr:peptide chain release factor N(5)-glutamine methyltransferase [Clostridiales bacterium]
MTYRELQKFAEERLKNNGVEDSSFDALCLVEHFTGKNKTRLKLEDNSEVDSEHETAVLHGVDRRIAGEPLQYILGEWEFYGFPFKVGTGVLIPRPETEMLVDFGVKLAKDIKSPVIFDLCAGSGCIGISAAKLLPDARVYCVEKSPAAFEYLNKNIGLNRVDNVTAVMGDIFDGLKSFGLPEPDIILSNPPYIESDMLNTLQPEVRLEPMEALDGGEDGYIFYECIASRWLPFVKGALAVECGEGQAEKIALMFETDEILKDFNNIKRVVIRRKSGCSETCGAEG